MASFLGIFSGKTRLEAEKARLEAFLSAFPGEYCGWSRDGSVAYSQGFCDILGLEKINSIADIQNKLSIGDAAALEGVFNRLKENGLAFQITVRNMSETKTFRISGSQGSAYDNSDYFHILWIEDITEQTSETQRLKKEHAKDSEWIARLETSLNSFPWPLWKRDENQALIWCNQAYADLTGEIDPEHTIRAQKEISPASRKKKKGEDKQLPAGTELAKKALQDNAPQQTKIHVIHEGKRLLMRIFENPVPAQNMTVGFAEDITEQENIEDDLKRYQATNEELLEQLRTAIAIFDGDQRLEFYNSAFSQLWGQEDQWLNTHPKLGELMEKLREERKLPEQADFRRFKKSWLDMFTSLLQPHEDMLYLPDGSALRMLAVPHSAGGLMLTFEDVTSRLELESSYNTLIAVQKETLDNLAEGVAVYGGDGRLKLWNPSFARLWGLNPEDLEGEPHINVLVEKKKKFFQNENWPKKKEELIAKGLDRVMHEGRLKRSNDTLVDFSTVPLPDGGVLITYTDVTDTVRVENALREKNAALEAAEKLKMDFLANVSYQLRTPLNAIMGFNDILHQQYFGPLNQRQLDYTQDIRSASDRLLNLINDILDLSTIEAGYMSLEKTPVKIRAMLENITDLAQEWARKGKIEINLKCPANIGTIDLDERRIKQALINIIRNSITFTPVNGRIELNAKRRKTGIEITVKDTGVGISREHHTRIFEPFEKAGRGGDAESSGQSSKGGAGLGLALVKNIMKLHGGSVNLESEPNEGTTVTIFLPFEIETTHGEPIKKALSFQ
ncbi:MAG: PAS-domain containing protein [Alphaproteobacteria bacterium]